MQSDSSNRVLLVYVQLVTSLLPVQFQIFVRVNQTVSTIPYFCIIKYLLVIVECTQERSHINVLSVTEGSLIYPHVRNTREYMTDRSRTSVICAVRDSVSQVTCSDIERDTIGRIAVSV